jgi:hypothetical protein
MADMGGPSARDGTVNSPAAIMMAQATDKSRLSCIKLLLYVYFENIFIVMPNASDVNKKSAH